MDLKQYHVANTAGLATPALLVYRDIVESNIRRAIEVAGGTQRLQPHIKTHKSPDVVRMLQAAGIARFKCATIAEAEMLAQTGIDDVVLAYQMVGRNTARYASLCRAYPETSFGVLVDNETMLQQLSQALVLAGATSRVLIDLDVGMHRTGIPVGLAAERLYAAIAGSVAVTPGGIHAYDGHTREPDFKKRCEWCDAIIESVRGFRKKLEAAGMAVPRMIMGGTPGFPCYARHADADLSPGTFAMHDMGYGGKFPDLGFTPAAVLLTRVISTPESGHMTVDLGTKAIASDPPQPRGTIIGMESAEPMRQNEEHWVFKLPAGVQAEVGQEFYVVPTHICPSFALHREMYVIDESRSWVETWPVAARDRVLTV